jgi:hypothetical protein
MPESISRWDAPPDLDIEIATTYPVLERLARPEDTLEGVDFV